MRSASGDLIPPSFVLPLIAGVTVTTVALTLYCFSHGISTVFMHLYYLPIILIAYFYRRRGMPVFIGLSLLYLALAIFFTYPSLVEIGAAVLRFGMFILIGVVVAELSERLERKKEDYRIAHEYESSIIDNANVWLIVLDKTGKILVWNRAAETISGYHAEEVLGRTDVWKALYPDKDYRKKITGTITRIVEEQNYLENFESEVRTKDGGTKVISWNTRGMTGAEGEVDRYIAIGLDITGQKRVEEALRESETKYREFFTTSRDCVFITSPGGQWIDFNDVALEMFGFSSREELKKVPVPQLYENPQERTAFLNLIVRQGYAKEFPIRLRRKDGVVMDTLITTVPVKNPDGSIRAFVGTIRNITEQKRANEERELIHREQQGANQILESVLAPASVEEKLKSITEGIVRVFDADFSRIWLIDKGDFCNQECMHAEVVEGPHVCRYRDRCLHLIVSSGRYTHIDGKAHRRVPFGAYKIGLIASGEERKFLTNDVQHDPGVHDHNWAKELELVSFAGYQLKPPGGETLGVFALFAKHPISPAEDAILEGLGSAIALVIQKDITEQALQESERKFHTMADFTVDWEYWLAPDGSIVYISPSCEEMCGYSAGEFTADPMLMTRIVHPEDALLVSDHFSRIHTSHDRGILDFRIVRKDGEIRWLAHTCLPVYGSSGTYLGRRASNRDITDRKRAEEALHKSEEKYRLIAETSSDIIWQLDLKGNFTYVSPAVEKIFGYTPEEAVTLNFKAFFADAEIGKATDVFINAVSGVKYQTSELVALKKNGLFIPIEVSVNPVIAGNKIIGVQGIARDITKRRQVEETIRESEERYRTLAEASPDQIFIVGRDDTMKYVNSACLKLFRLPYDQVVGKPMKNLFPPDIADAQGILLKKVFETGEKIQQDGKVQFGTQESWINTSLVPLKDKRGDVTAILGISRDITDRKRAEEEIRLLNVTLEQRVRDRTQELEHATDQIRASLDEKVVLLREIHHRVKNNLQIIISLLHLQAGKFKDQNVLDAIMESQNRLRAMAVVHERLYQSDNLSQIELDGYLRSLITQIFSSYRIDTRRVKLSIDIPKTMIELNTAIPLGLVMNELVGNSLKHAFPHGREGTLSVNGDAGDAGLTITLSDNGVGIPAGFDLRQSETLGLKIVTTLVQQINGTIELVPGPGTTWRIVIPKRE